METLKMLSHIQCVQDQNVVSKKITMSSISSSLLYLA